jgi:Na+/H+-dicarboxylate symporter
VLFKYLLVLCFVIIYINFSKHNYNLSLVNLAKFIASFNVLLCSFVCLFVFFFLKQGHRSPVSFKSNSFSYKSTETFSPSSITPTPKISTVTD